MLEQIAYEIPRVSEARQEVYRVGNLESLSAVALYYGSGGSPLGSLGSFGIVSTPLMKSGEKLTIRDFPASGFQMHIHEGDGGTSHLKTYNGEKILMSSYDAAMADGGKATCDAMELIEKGYHLYLLSKSKRKK